MGANFNLNIGAPITQTQFGGGNQTLNVSTVTPVRATLLGLPMVTGVSSSYDPSIFNNLIGIDQTELAEIQNRLNGFASQFLSSPSPGSGSLFGQSPTGNGSDSALTSQLLPLLLRIVNLIGGGSSEKKKTKKPAKKSDPPTPKPPVKKKPVKEPADEFEKPTTTAKPVKPKPTNPEDEFKIPPTGASKPGVRPNPNPTQTGDEFNNPAVNQPNRTNPTPNPVTRPRPTGDTQDQVARTNIVRTQARATKANPVVRQAVTAQTGTNQTTATSTARQTPTTQTANTVTRPTTQGR